MLPKEVWITFVANYWGAASHIAVVSKMGASACYRACAFTEIRWQTWKYVSKRLAIAMHLNPRLRNLAANWSRLPTLLLAYRDEFKSLGRSSCPKLQDIYEVVCSAGRDGCQLPADDDVRSGILKISPEDAKKYLTLMDKSAYNRYGRNKAWGGERPIDWHWP
jgi:hypothetical protein